jgi:7-cyano-7-deazaguanine synthase in queuosine biosynthesis
MCGITAYWAKESIPCVDNINALLKSGEKRGTDSVGWCLFSPKENKIKFFERFSYIKNSLFLSRKIIKNIEIGDVFLSCHRSAPETEELSNNEKLIQPIINKEHSVSLVHNGSVSNKIYNDLKNDFVIETGLDSEAIIWAYIKNGRNMKSIMEYLSGGFSFILIDEKNSKLFAVCTHNPLWCGYSKGHGMFFSSLKEGITNTLSSLKGKIIVDNNLSVWEDFYIREVPENIILEIDLDSGMINEIKFEPRYITNNFDTSRIKKREEKECVLVAASGGLDSTTSLATFCNSGLDVKAVYFNYGHRGGEAEKIAITNITKILDIPLIEFDISNNMKQLDGNSMLIDKNSKIVTGTDQYLKTTAAWTCFRNGLFVTYMGALAEKLIKEKYTKVYISGGFLNLSESGAYPDNSERFIKKFKNFANLSSICGTRIFPLYGLCNLLKSEEYILLERLGLLERLSKFMISCDRPTIIDGVPHNCMKDNKPACGSGALSYWAAQRAGVQDYKKYYEVDDFDYKIVEKKIEVNKKLNIIDIFNKIEMDEKYKNILNDSLNDYSYGEYY